MQSLRYGLGDYECHACAANFALKCLYEAGSKSVDKNPMYSRYVNQSMWHSDTNGIFVEHGWMKIGIILRCH